VEVEKKTEEVISTPPVNEDKSEIKEDKKDKKEIASNEVEAEAEPVPEASKSKGVLSGMFDFIAGSDTAIKDTKEEEEDYFDEIEKA
jgi:hypothetical protein